MTQKEQEKITTIVRAVINEWNPYHLIEAGVNDDEFASEIKAVVRQFERIGSAEDAAYVISRVFSSSFEPSTFRLEGCRAVGARLFEALTETYGRKRNRAHEPN